MNEQRHRTKGSTSRGHNHQINDVRTRQRHVVLQPADAVPEGGDVGLSLDVHEQDAGQSKDEEGDEPVQVEGEEEAGQCPQERGDPVVLCCGGVGV